MLDNQLDKLWEDTVKYLQNHGTPNPKETVEEWQYHIARALSNNSISCTHTMYPTQKTSRMYSDHEILALQFILNKFGLYFYFYAGSYYIDIKRR